MTPNLPAWTALDSVALPSPPGAPGEAGGLTVLVASDGAVEAGWASACAVELARSWATAGYRVVLADADVLAPTLHEELRLPNHEGLSDVLLWGASVRRVAQVVKDGGFYLMSAGTVVADGAAPFRADRWSDLCRGFGEAGVILAAFTREASVSSEPVLARASEVVLLAGETEDLSLLADRIGVPVVGVVGRRDGGAETTGEEPDVTEAGARGGVEEADPYEVQADGQAPVDVGDEEVRAPGSETWGANAPPIDGGGGEATEPVAAGWDLVEPAGSEAEATVSMNPDLPEVEVSEGVGSVGPQSDGSESVESTMEPGGSGGDASGNAEEKREGFGEGEVEGLEVEGTSTTELGNAAIGDAQAADEESVATSDQAELGSPPGPPLNEILEEEATPPVVSSRRGPVLFVVLIVVLLGIVGAALLGFLRIPGIPQLLGSPAQSGVQQSSAAVVNPVGSFPTPSSDVTPVASHPAEVARGKADPAELTPVARFDIAIAAYRNAAVAAGRASRLRRAVPGLLVTCVPVEVKGKLFHRVLVGVAATSEDAAALTERVARATGLSSSSWVTRSTPRAFYFGESAEQGVAAGRVEELEARGLPAYALAVDYSDGSVRYRVYVGAFADRVEASYMSTRLKELGLDGTTLSDRFGRLPE